MNRIAKLFRSIALQRASERLRRSNEQNLLLAQDLAKLHASHASLLKMNKEGQLGIASLAVIKHMTMLMQLRDMEGYQHGMRVARLSSLLARKMDIDPSYCTMLELAAPLHDIGILALPATAYDEALDQRGARMHTELGDNILRSNDHILSIAAMIARSHHEHFDGSGFPDGLIGENIPLEARIVAVADRFDDLLHGLHGNPRLTAEEAFNDIFAQYGKHFDPKVIRALNLGLEEFMRMQEGSPIAKPAAAHMEPH